MGPGNEAVLQATESWAGPENEATSYIDRQTAEQQNFIPYSGKLSREKTFMNCVVL